MGMRFALMGKPKNKEYFEELIALGFGMHRTEFVNHTITCDEDYGEVNDLKEFAKAVEKERSRLQKILDNQYDPKWREAYDSYSLAGELETLVKPALFMQENGLEVKICLC